MPLLFCYAADFADIFEVQGTVRKARGEVLPARTANQTVKLSYRGLDDVVRTTHIEFSHAPVAISATQAEFKLQLRTRQQRGAVDRDRRAGRRRAVAEPLQPLQPTSCRPTCRSAWAKAHRSALRAVCSINGSTARALISRC